MASSKSHTVSLFATILIIFLVFCGIGEARDLKDSDVIDSERNIKSSPDVFGSLKDSRDKIESLGYGAIAKDRIPGCSSANPNECIKHPANHYSRGCEISTRCRRPPMTQKLYF
ncbi:hypothetical protein EUTSA_v10012132mg [Eutrema salsugineum]|uniref:Rapid alkalinization factor 1 n=1 Tax=Eutrema salsugineum TaxID=72664 RepID=V4KM00_EUTSA|nr:hypothetical protein EUTSA_v10012132mg [Eutrema salsugineum]